MGIGYGIGKSSGKNKTTLLNKYRSDRAVGDYPVTLQPNGTTKNPCTYNGVMNLAIRTGGSSVQVNDRLRNQDGSSITIGVVGLKYKLAAQEGNLNVELIDHSGQTLISSVTAC